MYYAPNAIYGDALELLTLPDSCLDSVKQETTQTNKKANNKNVNNCSIHNTSGATTPLLNHWQGTYTIIMQ